MKHIFPLDVFWVVSFSILDFNPSVFVFLNFLSFILQEGAEESVQISGKRVSFSLWGSLTGLKGTRGQSMYQSHTERI